MNIRTVILGVIVIIVGLIMLGIAMDTITPMVETNGTVNWTSYPGGQAMVQLFPFLMFIGLILFGGLLVWIGVSGQQIGIRDTILATVVVIVAIIMLPMVVTQTDTLLAREDISTYTGLSSFLGLVPLLYVVGLLFITGLLGFKAVRGKIPTRRKKAAY